jgi:hypothetical protein
MRHRPKTVDDATERCSFHGETEDAQNGFQDPQGFLP